MRLFHAVVSFGLVLGGTGSALAVEPGIPHQLLTQEVLTAEVLEQRLLEMKAGSGTDVAAMKAFYAKRSYQPIWITETRLGESARKVIDEISRADDFGLQVEKFDLPDAEASEGTSATLVADEIRLTRAVLKYAVHARGGRIDPRSLSAYLDRGAYLESPAKVLASVSSGNEPDAYLRGLHPQHEEFKRLRARYLELRDGAATAKRVNIPSGPLLKTGRRHQHVALLRERLNVPVSKPKIEETAFAEDDVEDTGTVEVTAEERAAIEARRLKRASETYDAPLIAAVRAFQKKNGLKVDGVVGSGTRKALNGDGVDLKKRLLVNMERWRWMPPELGDTYVWANIPDYRFYYIKNGKIVHTERVVVGKYQNQTATFSDEMEEIVFNPRWNVPLSIKDRELRSASALRRQGLKVKQGGRTIDPTSVNWSTANMSKYHIYQPSGPRNALGRMKFLFPNKHAIYMHDTPSKSLFNRTARAYSHGCVRVRDPQRFAEVILAHDQGISRSSVQSRIAGGKRNSVFLKTKLPVHITYFTARADGKDPSDIRVMRDIYFHDNRIDLALAGKPPKYIAQNSLSAPRRTPRKVKTAKKKSSTPAWAQQLFGWN